MNNFNQNHVNLKLILLLNLINKIIPYLIKFNKNLVMLNKEKHFNLAVLLKGN